MKKKSIILVLFYSALQINLLQILILIIYVLTLAIGVLTPVIGFLTLLIKVPVFLMGVPPLIPEDRYLSPPKGNNNKGLSRT